MNNGTEKQIAWAKDLKESALSKIPFVLFIEDSDNQERVNTLKSLFEQSCDFIKNNEDSQFWIREKDYFYPYKLMCEMIRNTWKQAPAQYIGFNSYGWINRNQKAS